MRELRSSARLVKCRGTGPCPTRTTAGLTNLPKRPGSGGLAAGSYRILCSRRLPTPAALVAGWLIVALATGHLLAPGLLGLLMGGVLAFSLRYALYRRRHR